MRRPDVVRRAAERSRASRLRAFERRLVGHLGRLRKHDPDAHEAFVGTLRRVVEISGK